MKETAQPPASLPNKAALVFRHVALIGKHKTAHAPEVLLPIVRFLQEQGCKLSVEELTAQHNPSLQALHLPTLTIDEIGKECQLALVVGGDGTMLGAARQLAPYGMPMVGINQGRLGFITDISMSDFALALAPILHGKYVEDQRRLMHAKVVRGAKILYEAYALNDVVVHRGANPSMIELRVEVSGRFVANQLADGLIVATPTGSTAYALSAGGPLLHPSVPGWVLVPLAPHSLSNRPIVLDPSAGVCIEIVAAKEASASFDMQSFSDLQPKDYIDIHPSAYVARLLHSQGWSYYDTLRKKLHWNEGGSSAWGS